MRKRVCPGLPHSAFSLCRQPPALGLPQPQGVRGGDRWICEFAHPNALLLSEVRVPEEIQPDPLAPCPWLVLPIRGLWVSSGGRSPSSLSLPASLPPLPPFHRDLWARPASQLRRHQEAFVDWVVNRMELG